MKNRPDFENLRKTILRQPTDGIVPSWELFADREIMERIICKKFPNIQETIIDPDIYNDRLLEFQLKMGYDYMTAHIPVPINRSNNMQSTDTADMSKGQRSWVDENTGNISSMEDFHAFSWPKSEDISYARVENAAKKLPEGMKLVVTTTGILENVQWLMGYTSMALAIYDCPELIEALFKKVGSLMEDVYKTATQIPGVGMAAMGDDMGFKGGTLFAPSFLREYVLPWQKKCSDAAHKNGVPFILHTCGQVREIMDDLVEYVGIDAKHSFEDEIMPVEDVYKEYKGRVTLIGGIDVDLLCRGSEEDVRNRVRTILAKCSEGGYIMGSGNSITNYMKPENYLAMIDELNLYNRK